MKDLALEVGNLHLITIDDSDASHPGGGQIKGGRRA
jgi:hypothetical protein